MTTKQELDAKLEKLHAEELRIEAEIAACYKASLELPESEKVCADWMAQDLSRIHAGFIKYPIAVSGITHKPRPPSELSWRGERQPVGCWVAIRTVSDDRKEKGKTFLGVYLGDFPTTVSASHHPETKVLEVGLSMYNPAIWVPDLKRVVFGMESWWGLLKKPEDLKQITDADIQNVWYVKALRELSEAAP